MQNIFNKIFRGIVDYDYLLFINNKKKKLCFDRYMICSTLLL